jgi:hypothetical protein
MPRHRRHINIQTSMNNSSRLFSIDVERCESSLARAQEKRPHWWLQWPTDLPVPMPFAPTKCLG